jgi:hypothetical protein
MMIISMASWTIFSTRRKILKLNIKKLKLLIRVNVLKQIAQNIIVTAYAMVLSVIFYAVVQIAAIVKVAGIK